MLLLRATAVILIVASLAHTQTPAPTPAPSPTPSPAATPPPKHLVHEWEIQLPSASENNVASWLVAGEKYVFVPDAGGALEARNFADGRVAWSWSDRCVISPVIAGSVLAIVTDASLIAIDQASGQVKWRAKIEGSVAPVVASGSADRIALLFKDGIQTWDAAGEPGWHASFAGLPVTNVATAGGLLIFGTDEPAIIGIEAASGQQRWKIPLTTKPRPIAATTERIYFGGDDGNLYAYRIDGKVETAWRPFRRPLSIGPPLVDAKAVYFTLLDNTVSAFTAGGGTQLWGKELETRPLAGPFQLGETLGVALTDGRVTEVEIKKGKEVGSPAGTSGNGRHISAAESVDGARIYTVRIATDFSRTLVAWGHSKSGDGKH